MKLAPAFKKITSLQMCVIESTEHFGKLSTNLEKEQTNIAQPIQFTNSEGAYLKSEDVKMTPKCSILFRIV